jgi:acyl-CoA dehydrogenase
VIVEFSDKVKDLQRRLQAFLDEHIYPNERRYRDEIEWNPLQNVNRNPN